MTKRTVLGLAAVFALAGAASADTMKERLALAMKRLDRGEHALVRARSMKSNAEALQELDLAVLLLGEARRSALANGGAAFDDIRVYASAGLVRALDAESEIYVARGSTSLARARAVEALGIDPADSRANNLVAAIDARASTDVYAANTGTAAIDRIRERRAASGMPLRDRGVATRR